MLYHTCICVRDVERSATFYDPVMAVLGYKRFWNLTPDAIAYGVHRGEFWIQTPENQKTEDISQRCHYAFTAPDRATVDALHAAAVAAGGVTHMPPGHYPEYHPLYYGAVIEDLDTNKIEIMLYPRDDAERDREGR